MSFGRSRMHYGDERCCSLWQAEINTRAVNVAVDARDAFAVGSYERGKKQRIF